MSINNSSNLKFEILRSASVVGLATFLSRLTGFARDVVLAYFFGTGIEIQAFIVALRLPNLLRDLVAEGVTNSTFVPVFSKLLSQDKRDEFLKVCKFLFRLITLLLLSVVILGEILAPILVRLIAPGFFNEPGKFSLTVTLTRIMFSYILLIGLVSFNSAILNSLNNFAPSAIAPVLLNIAIIIGAVISAKALPVPILGLGWAVIFGGIFQLLFQIPSLLKNKIKPWHGFFDFKIDAQVKKISKRIARLFSPRLVGSAVYQLNVFIDTVMASLSWLVGEGAVAAIYYANRIIQLPLGLFAFSLSSALLPQLSSLAAKKDNEKLIDTLCFALKTILVIMLPISAYLILRSGPIIKAVFQRGQFSVFSSQITSWALLFYCLGLFFFAAVRIILACFYALEDTRRPVEIAFICLIANVLLNIILAIPLKVGGLALASSLVSLLNLTLLARSLKRHIPLINYYDMLGRAFFKVLFATTVMALVTKMAWQYLFTDLSLIIRLSLNLILAMSVYLGLAFLFKISEITEVCRWILKRN
ncbi:MAG: murein biosynthesis integral membrane protein MurJ [Candidatus Omnitrophota bacterium]